MKIEKTARGFKIVKFKDVYGCDCSLQESSSAEEERVWLGCDNCPPKHPVTGEELNPRMHLNVKQIKKLIKYLQNFVDTGSF